MQIPLLPEDLAAIEAARQRSGSTNTKRGYEGAWRRFAAWCEGRGYPALPTAPEVLAAYLLLLGREGKALATIRFHRAAVVERHKAGGLPHPADSGDVRVAISDLERSLGSEQTQARPLDEAAFAVIRRTAAIPRRRPGGGREGLDEALDRGKEDIAIISVMRDAMLRAGEAAALVWADIRPWSDGTGRVYIRRSKTDQRATGALQHIDEQAMSDLELIRPGFHQDRDTVFRMGARQLSVRIRDAAKAAGLGGGFSGHSPRIGMAIDLAIDGSGLPELQQAGRWTSDDQPAKYIRGMSVGQGAVARFYAKRKSGAENAALEPSWTEPDISNFLFNHI